MTSTGHRGVGRPVAWGLAGLAILLVVWGVTVALAAVAARDDLRAAEQAFGTARDAAGELEVEDAEDAFAEAARRLDDARNRLHAPHVRAAAAVPWVGHNLEVPRAMAQAGVVVADAGEQLVAAVEGLPAGADSLKPRSGRFPVAAIDSLTDPTARLATAVTEARDLVAQSPSSWLLGEVADGRERFLELTTEVEPTVTDLADLTRALPAFMGVDAPRRYFLAASNPAELRATGGYLGSYTVATFDDGRLELEGFSPLRELEDLPPGRVDPPNPSYGELLEDYGGTGVWKNLNVALDFPSVASAYEALWQATTGQELDGTIVVDPFAFEALVDVAGPVSLPDGDQLEDTDVVEYVANQAYEDLGAQGERQVLLGDVAEAALSGFLEGVDDEDLRASVDVLGDLVADGHLMVHSAHGDVQAVFEQLGIAGRLLDPDGDHLAVVANSASNAKVDYWAERTVDYWVDLQDDERAAGTLQVEVHNAAPTTGESRHVIGPNVPRLEAGGNRFLLSAYGSTGTSFTGMTGGLTGQALRARELGHPVSTTWMQLASGERDRVTWQWEVDGAWSATAGQLVYELTIQDQVTIRPTEYRVAVAIPEDFVPSQLPEGAEDRGDEVVWERTGERGDARLTFRFEPTVER